MKLKAILVVFVALILLLTCAAYAEEYEDEVIASGECGNELAWNLYKSGELDILGVGDMQNYSNTGAPWYAKRNDISTVYAVRGITSIGNYAFSGCTSLVDAYIPDTVTSIGNGAFSGCPQSMVIYCVEDSYAESYAIQNGFDYDYFAFEVASGECGDDLVWEFDTDGRLNIYGTGTMRNYTKSGAPWYAQRSDIEVVDVRYGITSIGNYAFSGCTSVSEIFISDTVTSIGSGAFDGCPENMTIGCIEGSYAYNYAIKNDFSYEHAVFYMDGGNCGEYVWWDINTDGCLQIYGYDDMYDYTAASQTPWYKYREGISEIVIEESVTSIGAYAFSDCKGLSSVSIPRYCTSIGASAFRGCSALEAVYMYRGVTSVGNYAFSGCASLTEAEIPDTVTSIGTGAFSGCPQSMVIYCMEDSYAERYAIQNGFDYITVAFITDSGVCGDNLEWSLDTDGWLYISGTGEMWDYAKTEAPWYEERGNIKVVNIERSGATSIGDYAFYGCSSIEAAYIPDTVTSIGSGALSGCSQNMVIYCVEDSYAEHYAIQNDIAYERVSFIVTSGICGEDLTWNIDTDDWLNISGTGDMWGYAKTEAPWYEERGNIKIVYIESGGVTSIGDYAFYGCSSIEAAYIPDTVASIGVGAFSGCAKSMVIKCAKGSYAESYAIQNGFAYEQWAFDIDGGICGDGTEWCIDTDGCLSIFGDGDMYDYGSASETPWYEHRSDISTINVGDGVTSVGTYAFSGCTSAIEANIYGNDTSIGAYAFSDCGALENIFMDFSVKSISKTAFSGHSSGFKIRGFAGSYAEAFAVNQGISFEPLYTPLRLPESTSCINSEAFRGDDSICCVIISFGCESIEAAAFADCGSMEYIYIPSSVTYIAEDAFANHKSDFGIVTDSEYSAAYSYASAHSIGCVVG